MPGGDRTGPRGEGPMLGRGFGRGFGFGAGQGRGQGRGIKKCVCSNCGENIEQKRGIPCSTTKCSKCGTQMRGDFCLKDLDV